LPPKNEKINKFFIVEYKYVDMISEIRRCDDDFMLLNVDF
jgi:hypothetical protein